MKTIYYGDYTLSISKTNNAAVASNGHIAEVSNDGELNAALNVFLQQKKIHTHIICKSPKAVFKTIAKQLEVVEAAGGVVIGRNNATLCIERQGMWDLPKGHIEKGEKPKAAAIREVQEETGLQEMRIVNKLKPSWHIYYIGDKCILKKTHWYCMASDAVCANLKPQHQEDISQAVWLSAAEIVGRKSQFWTSLLPVLASSCGD